jgi:hypothetical protein
MDQGSGAGNAALMSGFLAYRTTDTITRWNHDQTKQPARNWVLYLG